MISKKYLVLISLAFSSASFASGINHFTIPFGKSLNTDGSVVVELDSTTSQNYTISNSFYGADAHGFSDLPTPALVSPLELGYVKFGGSLHSTYNWSFNAYYDRGDNGIAYVYSPIERRLRFIKNYKAEPMFQVNMLGWQPDMNSDGQLTYQNTADAKHAADGITYINGIHKIGLQNVIMGNEPFNAFEVHGKSIPSADEYIDSYLKYAVAIREAQEKISGNPNDIKLWGPEIAMGWTAWQTTHPDDCVFDGDLSEKYKCSYGNGEFSEFMPYFLARISDFERDPIKNPKKYKMLDYITWHYYPLFRKNFMDPGSIILNSDGKQNIAGMLESVNVWDSENYINKYDYSSPRGSSPKIINKFKNWRARFYPNAKLAITEFGIDSVPNISYHPIVRPLYLADLIARAAGAGVDTFIHSFLQNGSSASSWELINGGEKTKLYNVFSMFSNNFKGRVLSTNDNYGDEVNVYSVKTNVGTNVFLINKDPKVHISDLRFKNSSDLFSVTHVTLPAWSVTLLKVPDSHNGPITVEQYGAKEMGINISSLQ